MNQRNEAMLKGLLKELPAPKNNKQGWPWTVETDPTLYKEDDEYPKISVVTPSYNQAEFIEETIRSVLLQNYPNLEFIIMDGGSTDETVKILKKYDPWIDYWVSEEDRGQAHAINKGVLKATGDFIGWQNSDDIYLKRAFYYFLETQNRNLKMDVYFGNLKVIDGRSMHVRSQFYTPFSFFEYKYYGANISNQAAFFNSTLFRKNLINEDYKFALEEDLYFKLANARASFIHINKFLGAFRVHAEAKSSTIKAIAIPEAIEIRKKYGIIQSDKPWENQFVIQKQLSKIRKLVFYMLQGNFFSYLLELLKKNKH